MNEKYLNKAVNFFIDLENDKKTFLYTPHRSLIHNICLKLSKECLRINNIHTFASILNYREISKDKILIIPVLKSEMYHESYSLILIEKLEKLVSLL